MFHQPCWEEKDFLILVCMEMELLQETLLGIWRLASRWGMCLGIGVWSIIGGGIKRVEVKGIKAEGEGQFLIW